MYHSSEFKMVLGALFLTFFSVSLSLQRQINPKVMEISCDQRIEYTINKTVEYIVSVKNVPHDILKPPRGYFKCADCTEKYPIIISFRQDQAITSVELPMTIRLSNEEIVLYDETEKTLCPVKGLKKVAQNVSVNSKEGETLIISLSTSSPVNVNVSFHVSYLHDFLLHHNDTKNFTLTPSTPHFYAYEFSKDVDATSLILKVESQTNECMVVSIQNKTCPIIDTGIPYKKGYFQTVTKLGAIVIMRDKFPQGFYAVFSLFPDDSSCSGPVINGNSRSKNVTVSIFKSVHNGIITNAIEITVEAIFIFFVLMVIITHFYFNSLNQNNPIIKEPAENTQEEPSTSNPIVDLPEDNNENAVIRSNADAVSIQTDSSLDETDIDILHPCDKNIMRMKVGLCVSDLARKNPLVLEKKSSLYLWNLITVGIFYALPAAQVVITYQFDLNQSGNTDICYYNYLCSNSFGYFNDFNHFFSNIAYLINGCIFLIITQRKRCMYRKLICQHTELEKHYGLPQHFGLFYAMGTSLIIEGVLSACYHICPNIYNFQFDISFMYIIGTLCMIKLYQSRHPDVNATAYSTFFLIALLLFLPICGIFGNIPFFWFFLTVTHLSIIFYLSVQIYYIGSFTFDLRSCVRYLREWNFNNYILSRPLYPKRFVLIVISNICNLFLAMGEIIVEVKDVASYLLVIFMANLMLYTTFYIIMKVISKEKILHQTLLYLFLSLLSWSAALYFFLDKTISWKKTPSESRLYNKPCVLLNFYDNHDIWHFLSSLGLFFSFLVLLTLDDDLIFIHRSKIPVF